MKIRPDDPRVFELRHGAGADCEDVGVDVLFIGPHHGLKKPNAAWWKRILRRARWKPLIKNVKGPE